MKFSSCFNTRKLGLYKHQDLKLPGNHTKSWDRRVEWATEGKKLSVPPTPQHTHCAQEWCGGGTRRKRLEGKCLLSLAGQGYLRSECFCRNHAAPKVRLASQDLSSYIFSQLSHYNMAAMVSYCLDFEMMYLVIQIKVL